MNISAKTKICMVIGDPIEHSLSPKIHNAGYEKLGIDTDYVYVACNVKIENIADFIKGVRAMKIRGVSCTIPHKIEVMKYLDEIDEVAKKIGAVNTIVNEAGVLKGYNTDWLGVVMALEKITSIENKKVALIGAGGVARAAAYGITQRGARLIIYNRTIEKAQELAEEFGGEARSLDDIEEIKNMDIIFNATSVGLRPNEHKSPLARELITDKHIVLDAIYVPYETKLLKEAKQQGARRIHGMEMLLQQGIAQFKLYTGYNAPEKTMRDVLL
jgi:shikimate dehydrogenase